MRCCTGVNELINMDEYELSDLTRKGVPSIEEEVAALDEELVLAELEYILRQAARYEARDPYCIGSVLYRLRTVSAPYCWM